MKTKTAVAAALLTMWFTVGIWWALAASITVALLYSLTRAKRGRPCSVYAGYTLQGLLGYVGEGYAPARRWRRHKRKPWGAFIVRWEILAVCESKAEARALEEQLIRAHQPLFNKTHNTERGLSPHGMHY